MFRGLLDYRRCMMVVALLAVCAVLGWRVVGSAPSAEAEEWPVVLAGTTAVAADEDEDEEDDDDDDSAFCIINSMALIGGLGLAYGLSLRPGFRSRLDRAACDEGV